MSEVHVHGVVPASEGAPEGARRIAHRDVAALVSDLEPGERAGARLLRAHWTLLEEIAARMTVLPVRFGTVLADDGAVVDAFLAPRHDRLAAELAALAGKVQLTVKGSYDEDVLLRDIVAREPAIARLRERVRGVPELAAYPQRIELGKLVAAAMETARERDAALVLERLEPAAAAASREPPGTPNTAVHAAFLVERERSREFEQAVDDLGRELQPRLRMRCIGPLPPYSFTREQTADGVGAWA